MVGGYEIVLWVLLLIASLTDLIWGKIYNALTFSFFISGILYRFIFVSVTDGQHAVLGVAAALLLFFPLYWIRAVAAGDVKLLMAVGSWTNSNFVLHIALLSIVVGAVVGLIVLLRNRGLRGTTGSLVEHLKNSTGKKSFRMPYAPAFLCAFLFMKIGEMQQWSLP